MNTHMRTEMDPLIDLLDAEEFESLLAREELRRSRTGETLAVAVLDVDGMRAVTSCHGAPARDEALRICAAALSRSIRTVDEAAYTDHDEFRVLLHATDAEKVAVWVERLEELLEADSAAHPAGPLTCAVGLADTTEESSLMEVAARARRRMEVIQTVRKLRRARESGS
jgi:diguanylate cyclase (GGDEF)-like protein